MYSILSHDDETKQTSFVTCAPPAPFTLAGSLGIRLLRSEIPRYVATGQHVPLSCHVLLGWRERIYAVNWYRDGHEFYRYNPGEVPAAQVFRQPHIHVDVSTNTVMRPPVPSVGVCVLA